MQGGTMVVATIPVSDLDQAKAFYGDTLGLELLWENPASIRWRCGDVSEVPTFKRPSLKTEHTLAHLEVTDIEATIKELEDKGVAFIDYDEGPLQTSNPRRPSSARRAGRGSTTRTATRSGSGRDRRLRLSRGCPTRSRRGPPAPCAAGCRSERTDTPARP